MRRLSLCALLFLLQSPLFAQGVIIFNNRTSTGDAPVQRPDGTGAGAGVTAQLMLVAGGNVLTPLFPVTAFRTFSPATAYFVQPIELVVPGIPIGSPATFRMRAWEGPSWEQATLRGESNDVFVQQLHGPWPPWPNSLPPSDLAGLQGFTLLPVPEPSSIALGALGFGALFMAPLAHPESRRLRRTRAVTPRGYRVPPRHEVSVGDVESVAIPC